MNILNTSNINTVIKMLAQFGVPYFKDNIQKSELEYINKGRNGRIYKYQYDNLLLSVKDMKLFTDRLPIISYFSTDKIRTLTGINDIIISYVLSENNHPTVQKLYGYKIYGNRAILIKEFCEYNFPEFIKKNNNELVSNLLLHIILAIKINFQMNIKGYLRDNKLGNILVRKTNDNYVKYKIKGKILKIKTFGYVPVLTDFGSAVIRNINGKKIIIARNKEWYKSDEHVVNLLGEIINENHIFDKSLDLFVLFYINIYIKNNLLMNNWIICEYIDNLNGMNEDNYKSNTLTINSFLKTKKMMQYVLSMIYV